MHFMLSSLVFLLWYILINGAALTRVPAILVLFLLSFLIIIVKETHPCSEEVSVIAMGVFVLMLFPCMAHAVVMIEVFLSDA